MTVTPGSSVENNDFKAVVMGPRRWIACGDLTIQEGPRMHYVPTSERARKFLERAATPGGRDLWHLSISIIPDGKELIFAVRTRSLDLDKKLAETDLARLTGIIADFESKSEDRM